MSLRYLLTGILLFAGIVELLAQDSFSTQEPTGAQLLREDGTDRDGTDVIEDLAWRTWQPIDINRATQEQLAELPGIGTQEASAIVQHRQKFGSFLRIEELQTIHELDVAVIRRLTPYIRIGDPHRLGDTRAGIRQEAVLRLSGAGAVWSGRDSTFQDRAGDGFRALLRYRLGWHECWTAGLRVEKDPGEAWLDQRHRPDYISGFICYRGQGLLRKLVLGDFAAQYGQGIACWLGFGAGFTSDPELLRRQARGILPYTSSDENAGLRGVAITLAKKNLSFDLFYSKRKRDAGSGPDSTGIFTSLQTSGIHSTASEVSGRSVLPWSLLGSHAGLKMKRSTFGVTGLLQQQYGILAVSDDAYAHFRKLPERFIAVAVDGTLQQRNATFFFEVACREGNLSQLAGVQLALGRYLDAGVQVRRYGNGTITWCSDAPAENSRSENEQGWLMSLQARFSPICSLQVLVHTTQFTWLRYGIDEPSARNEQVGNLTLNANRKTQFRFRYRRRESHLQVGTGGREQQTGAVPRESIRLSMTTALPPFLGLEARIEHLRDGKETGWIAFTDWTIRPFRSRVNGTLRFAVAETSSYASAIYSQEPEVLYGFSMPGYYGSMVRLMAVLKYRISKNLDLYLRSGWTRRGQESNVDHPGGVVQQDLSMQLRWTQGTR